MNTCCNIPTLSISDCCESIAPPKHNLKNPYLNNVKYDFTFVVENSELKEGFKDEVVYCRRRGNYVYLKGEKWAYKILVEDTATIEQFKKIKTLTIIVN